jgi:arsenate reductase (thioredoxin)
MKHILFVCTQNAGRSQMAQAFFERDGPTDVHAESAGSDPASALVPAVLEVMHEIGIDLSHRRPRKVLPETQLRADWAVTLNCGDACPYVPGIVEDWDVPDPAHLPIEDVRKIRNDIERRVTDLITHRLHAIYDDRTAHHARLERLLRPLIEEFGDTVDPAIIRRCADQTLERHADATVRAFVQTIAYREAAECLRTGGCQAPTGLANSVTPPPAA